MSDEKIERYKSLDEMTPDEHLTHMRTGVRPETAAYKNRRREALEDAGLEHDEDEDGVREDEDMTPEDHFQSMRGKP